MQKRWGTPTSYCLLTPQKPLALQGQQRDPQSEMSAEDKTGPGRRQPAKRKKTHLAQGTGPAPAWSDHPTSQSGGTAEQISPPAWMQLAINRLWESAGKCAHIATLVLSQSQNLFLKPYAGAEISETRWPLLTTRSPWRFLVINCYPLITLTGVITKRTFYKRNVAFPCYMGTDKGMGNWKHFWKNKY